MRESVRVRLWNFELIRPQNTHAFMLLTSIYNQKHANSVWKLVLELKLVLEVKSEALNLQLLVTGFHSLLLSSPKPYNEKKSICGTLSRRLPRSEDLKCTSTETRVPAKCSPITRRTRQRCVSLIALERELKWCWILSYVVLFYYECWEARNSQFNLFWTQHKFLIKANIRNQVKYSVDSSKLDLLEWKTVMT